MYARCSGRFPVFVTMSLKKQLFEAVETNNLERVKFFIEKANVSVTTENASHQTLVHIAAKRNNVEILKYILEKNCSVVNNIDQFNNSPVHFATVKGAYEVVKCLVEEYDADIGILCGRDKDRTALHVAAEFSHMNILKYLIEERNVDFNVPHVNQTQPPIFLAVKSRQWEVIEYLIEEKNVDLFILNSKLETILFPIVRYGLVTFLKFLLDEKRVKLDVNSKNIWGETILHVAAHMNRIYLLKYLVKNKHADVNARKDTDKRTPLHYAAAGNHYVISKFLVDNGAKVHLKDQSGLTAVKLAKEKNLVAYLEGVMHPSRSRRNVGTLLSPLQPVPLPLPSDEYTRTRILGGLPRTVECIGGNNASDALTVSHLQGFLMLAKLTMKNLMQNERRETENIMMHHLSPPVYVLRNRISSVANDVIDETFSFHT